MTGLKRFLLGAVFAFTASKDGTMKRALSAFAVATGVLFALNAVSASPIVWSIVTDASTGHRYATWDHGSLDHNASDAYSWADVENELKAQTGHTFIGVNSTLVNGDHVYETPISNASAASLGNKVNIFTMLILDTNHGWTLNGVMGYGYARMFNGAPGFDFITDGDYADFRANYQGAGPNDGHFGFQDYFAVEEEIGEVPEPTTYALFALGALACGHTARRRRKRMQKRS